MKTRSDLIKRSLRLLNAIAAGQNPEPEDVNDIDETIDGILKSLNRRNIIYLSDYENFDDELIGPLATLVANENAPDFGQPRNPDSAEEAENMLREFRNSDWSSGDVIASQYF